MNMFSLCQMSSMIRSQQAVLFLQDLQNKYPQAFKRNFLFYSQMKTKGLLDEAKEFIPWVLSIMIFCSIYFSLGHYIENHYPQFDPFQAKGIAALAIMLFFMLIVPFIIKQIKHSSVHLYKQLNNTPLKLAILIILQALNIYFFESILLQGVLFFFAMSFGFVKFYKENLFRDSTKDTEYYQLQQIRRTCFWAYKQAKKAKFKMKFHAKNSEQFKFQQQQLTQYLELHLKLLKFENEMCMTYKYVDLDAYMDSLM